MEKESKEQKEWISLSETISTGDYENVKIEAGYSKIYSEDLEDPIKLIESGVKDLRKVLKKESKKIVLVDNWDNIKKDIMKDLVFQKFDKEPLRHLLINTGNEEIQEGNYWNDDY